MKILVTGGAGFIGSHLVDRLLREGVEVTAFDDLSTGQWANLARHRSDPRFTFIKGDIRDRASIQEALEDVEAVLHQAALVSVNRSVQDPVATNAVNVDGTLNVLKACVDGPVDRVVFASSSSVYGDAETLPKREDMPPNPISPYAVSKYAGEAYSRVFHRVYGLETVCLRYFNVYGPRQTAGPYSGVIPIFIDALLTHRTPAIFGDGEQTRDFTHVKDVVEANVLALSSKRAVGEAMNIARGQPVTINELAETLQNIMKAPHVKVVHVDPRPGDIKHSYADIGKAIELLNYHPQIDLYEGLTNLVANWKNLPT